MSAWPFGDLPLFGYDLLMVDPPWSFDNWSEAGEGKNAKRHYACMSVDAIKALPVGDLASRDAVLWLWATNPMLPQAMDVLKAWGFAYKTKGDWIKYNRATDRIAFGPGYILRNASESYLIGTVGAPQTTNAVRSAILAPRREHSRKPDQAYRDAEALMPQARRIDLFSRETRAGWDAWGREAGTFDRG